MDPLRQLAVAAPSLLYLAVALTAGALFSLGTSHFNSRSIELWRLRFQGLVIWDLCPFNAKLLLLLYPRQVPSHLALVFLLKVLTGGGNFLDAHEYDDYIPKVDTEASWNKEVLTETLAVFGGVLPPVDTERNPEGAKTQVFSAVMAFVMAIVTVLRIFLGFLKKL